VTTALTKAGRYEIAGELGRGAMGVVYKAVDPVIGRSVAVKTIRLSEEGTGLTRPELIARFQTEARAAGLLTHPNIVVVYDAGEEDGLYYITMELVEGKSLQALLDSGQAFPLPRVLRIMEQACAALQFAHERNVVHRDIKPANLMLTADDTVKVTDFGTAKILQFGTVQQTAHVMGTPSYMSPEQIKGRAVDGRSDIFALGVVLYEMITGEKPFPGESITTVIYKIVNETPIPPRQIDPSIHPGISAAVMKALAKEPEHRYQSCREMLEDLRNYRAFAADGPQQTMALNPQHAPAATVALGGRSNREADALAAATVRSLNARTPSPLQTPAVRRTGPVTPVQVPKKKSRFLTAVLALVLVGVIVYGYRKVRPVFDSVRQQRAQEIGSTPLRTGAPSTVDAAAPSVPPAPVKSSEARASSNSATAAPAASDAPASSVPVAARVKPAASAAVQLTPAAAEYKGRIEEAIANRGLRGRLRVAGQSNTLTLAGKLRPEEHAGLLRFLRGAPAGVQIVDDTKYDDTPVAAGAGGNDSAHPVPYAGLAAVHVMTDVLGATAALRGPGGRLLNQCATPCSFNNLEPSQYRLEVKKDGYSPVETAVGVRAGQVSDQKLTLEPLSKGLFISSDPSGADVFVNGDKSGQTPVTLPLAAGTYNVVLRLAGYDAHAESVQVKSNIQTTLEVKLSPRSSHVAWAQISSVPPGAEIEIDGVQTGRQTPSRVQVLAGLHSVALRLPGYRFYSTKVEVSEGGTVLIDGRLAPR
jgi:serine/threonine-protein kinase